MNFFEKIINGLSGTMPEPGNYGWFHLMFVAFVIIATVLLCYFCRNCSEKTVKRIALISWIVMLVLEIYKQLVFSFEYENGVAKWDYQWYAFPYQLCSTPLYVLPFIAFARRGRGNLQDACMSYMSTFSLFGGLVVFLYPNDVFVSTIGINIQTMVHHGLQLVLGIFFLVYNRKKLNIKYFLKGIIVFLITFTVALIFNLVFHTFVNETFNMFYISPYFPCTLPLLEIVYANVPYVVFLLIYFIGFILAAFVVFLAQWGIVHLVNKINEKKGRPKNA